MWWVQPFSCHMPMQLSIPVFACLGGGCHYFTKSPMGICQVDAKSRNGQMDRMRHSLLSVWPMTLAVVSSRKHRPTRNGKRRPAWLMHTEMSVTFSIAVIQHPREQPRGERVYFDLQLYPAHFLLAQRVTPPHGKTLLRLGWLCPPQVNLM